jgi:hypothetical protein
MPGTHTSFSGPASAAQCDSRRFAFATKWKISLVGLTTPLPPGAASETHAVAMPPSKSLPLSIRACRKWAKSFHRTPLGALCSCYSRCRLRGDQPRHLHRLAQLLTCPQGLHVPPSTEQQQPRRRTPIRLPRESRRRAMVAHAARHARARGASHGCHAAHAWSLARLARILTMDRRIDRAWSPPMPLTDLGTVERIVVYTMNRVGS